MTLCPQGEDDAELTCKQRLGNTEVFPEAHRHHRGLDHARDRALGYPTALPSQLRESGFRSDGGGRRKERHDEADRKGRPEAGQGARIPGVDPADSTDEARSRIALPPRAYCGAHGGATCCVHGTGNSILAFAAAQNELVAVGPVELFHPRAEREAPVMSQSGTDKGQSAGLALVTVKPQ